MTTQSFVPEHAATWFEIPVSDFERAKAFYGAVVGNPLRNEDGPNPMGVFPAKGEKSASGHIYPGKPAAPGTGPTIHLVIAAPLEDGLARVRDNGGQVVSGIETIPAGRFAYCLDLDGNSFGLFVRTE
jgi:predicted enzyme related to lactoylglutathione lyase